MFEFRTPKESLAKSKMKNRPWTCPEPAATVQSPALSNRAADLQEPQHKRDCRLPVRSAQPPAQGKKASVWTPQATHRTSPASTQAATHSRQAREGGYGPVRL